MKTILTILVLLAAILSGVYFANRYSDTLSDLSALRGEYSKTVDTAKHYKDPYGAEHSRVELHNVTPEMLATIVGAKLDSQAKRIGVPRKNITRHTEMQVHQVGEINFTLTQLDSLTAELLHRRGTDTVNNTITVSVPYSVDADLQINDIRKRKWFGASWRNYVDVYSEDEGVKIYKFSSYATGTRYSSFGGSLTAGLVLPTGQLAIVAGISWSPDFLRFKRRRK